MMITNLFLRLFTVREDCIAFEGGECLGGIVLARPLR